jgi:hypothetical protein
MADQTITVELLLQIKDEISKQLGQTNTALNQTKAAGQKAAAGIVGVSKSLKQAIAPIKAFNNIFKMVAGAGGTLYAFKRIAAAIGDMETAFAKANPESQKMAGSMTQFKMAIDESKGAWGALVAEAVSPARAVIIKSIQDMNDKLKESEDSVSSVGDVLGQVGVYTVKVFQALGRLIYDNFNLMRVTVKAIWKLIVAVGEFLWLPLKKGFLMIIQPIKAAFLGMVNWILQATTDMVNWIGKKLSDISGGRLGKDLLSFSAGQITMENLNPDTVKLKTWDTLMGEIGSTFSEVGDELKNVLDAYVDIFTRDPGTAKLYDVKPTEEAIKAAADQAKLDDAYAISLLEIQIATDAWTQKWQEQAQKDWEEKQKVLEQTQKDIHDMAVADKRARLVAAQSFTQDPLASIGTILQDAMEGAVEMSANGGGLTGMLINFFDLAAGGISTLMSSLAEFLPIILLVIAIMEILKGVFEIIQPVLDSIMKPILDVLKLIGNALGTLLLPVLTALEPIFYAVGFLLTNLILPAFQVLLPVFKLVGVIIFGVATAIIFVLNLIIDVINFFIPGSRWDIPKLAMPNPPQFHQGGTADDDMLAILKKGEVVLNPYKSKAYVAGGGGGGVTINAPNARYLDKGTAAELVRLGLAGMRA